MRIVGQVVTIRVVDTVARRTPLSWLILFGWVAAIIMIGLPATTANASQRPPWTWVAIYGEPGAPVSSPYQLFQQSASTPFDGYGSPSGVSFVVRGTANFSIGFVPIKGNSLSVGSYTDAQGEPFLDPAHPGLSLGFNGNECASARSGSFAVADVAFVNGIVSRFDATFVEPCNSGIRAVFGEIQYNEPPAGPLVMQAGSLVFPAKYVGIANARVPVSVTNPSTAAIPVGPVSVGGPGAADVAITSNTCPSLLGPAATCVITATVTPRGAGTRQSAISVASGLSSSSVAVTDTGIAGNGAIALDSAPSDPIGEGEQWNFDQANADIVASGSPGAVVVSAYRAALLAFQVSFSAPVGQTLAVGPYLDAASVATATNGGLEIGRLIDAGPSYCPDFTGQFSIRDVAFNGQGDLSRFAADAQGQCFPGGPKVFAAVRSGSAIGYSALSMQPPSGNAAPPMAFNHEVLGGSSAAQQVTITNTGVVPLAVSPAVTGANAPDFQVVASTCTPANPVPVGATCSTSVAFSPSAAGPRAASLRFTDNTLEGQHMVAMTGIGDPAPTFTYPLDQQWAVDTTRPFTWVTSPASQGNRLMVGTSPGGNDLVDSGVLPANQTSYNVPALSANIELYATALTEINGTWNARQTITFWVAPQVAAFTYPLDETVNPGVTQPFSWAVESQAQAYYLVVGTSPGSADLVNSGVLPPSQGSYTPAALPANTVLYATLFTQWVGSWSYYRSITFILQAGQATLTRPVNGQRVIDPSAPYTWSTTAQAQAYYLVVGTTPGNANLINSGILAPSRSYYHSVPLPTGVALYATIFTEISGSWSQYQQISFTAGPAGAPARAAPTKAPVVGRSSPPPAAPYSAFTLDSDNDYVGFAQQLTFTDANSTITAPKVSIPGSVEVAVNAPGHQFVANFAAPVGTSLATGSYPNATRAFVGTPGTPGLDVDGDGRGCNTVSGRFTIAEIAYDDQGNLAHFAADAEVHCDGQIAALFVSVRVASTVPYSALALQPAPGPTLLPLNMTSELLGSTSPVVPVTITDTGVAPLTISAAVQGIYAADYRIVASTCPAGGPLAPGASCSLSIGFTPHGLGDRSATLAITDSTARGVHLLTMSGTGTAPPSSTYPVAGQSGVDTSKPFSWNAGPGSEGNRLVVGTSAGAADLVDSGVLPASQTSYMVPALPEGVTLYATVSTEINGTWSLHQTVAFTAARKLRRSSPLSPTAPATPSRRSPGRPTAKPAATTWWWARRRGAPTWSTAGCFPRRRTSTNRRRCRPTPCSTPRSTRNGPGRGITSSPSASPTTHCKPHSRTPSTVSGSSTARPPTPGPRARTPRATTSSWERPPARPTSSTPASCPRHRITTTASRCPRASSSTAPSSHCSTVTGSCTRRSCSPVDDRESVAKRCNRSS